MALFLCCCLLLSLSASGSVPEQGDLISQQSCSSDVEPVSLLQHAVRIQTKVIEEQTPQEDDQEEDDELEEDLDNDEQADLEPVSFLQHAVRSQTKVIEEQTTLEDDQEEDDELEEDMDNDLPRHPAARGPLLNTKSYHDDQADDEDDRGGKQEGQWSNHRRRGARFFTTEAIGKTICHICSRRIYRKMGMKFGQCWRKNIWPKKLVNVVASRRRAEGATCFAVSALKKSVTRTYRGWVRQHTYKSRLGTGFNNTNKEHFRKTKTKMCRCLQSILSKCKNAECMQQNLCGCPSLCKKFKEDLGCKDSLLEMHQASERNNQSESEALVSRTSSETAGQNNLDTSVQGKCTSETQ